MLTLGIDPGSTLLARLLELKAARHDTVRKVPPFGCPQIGPDRREFPRPCFGPGIGLPPTDGNEHRIQCRDKVRRYCVHAGDPRSQCRCCRRLVKDLLCATYEDIKARSQLCHRLQAANGSCPRFSQTVTRCCAGLAHIVEKQAKLSHLGIGDGGFTYDCHPASSIGRDILIHVGAPLCKAASVCPRSSGKCAPSNIYGRAVVVCRESRPRSYSALLLIAHWAVTRNRRAAA
jgi:hypothetical protein